MLEDSKLDLPLLVLSTPCLCPIPPCPTLPLPHPASAPPRLCPTPPRRLLMVFSVCTVNIL
ncbi:hypothetical protein E2C01_082747 [Portunus trituberculatus]|uniref:Uncharacterized protein n=1 Tax=Portunus trituberculatus TaxID=210409 RepID=A0A5B7J2K7_PORTR|nr:hypothetical protein [Portunus trituberculatus]